MNKDCHGYKLFIQVNEFSPDAWYGDVWNKALEEAAKVAEKYESNGAAYEIRTLKIK